jgi:hypothetical protein
MQRILIFLLLLFPLCFGACSNNNPQGRVAVQGNITLNDEPLDNGSIQFESLPELQPKIMTGGLIRQGTFSIPASHGLVAGQEYVVRVRSVQAIPGTHVEAADPAESGPETRDIIPPQYGKASTLTFTATKTSPNVFSVNIKP